jgi:signal transduction histidine kinase
LKLYDRSKSPEKFYMQLNRIIQSVNKMVSLIDNVLIFGNLEREYFELRFTEIDVINVINSIIDDIVIIDQNMHKIEFNPIVSSINFKTDSIIFYHVINNIISNAIKYSSENTKIEIFVNDTIDTISIIVKDYGIGIPESDLIKVYEPFQRAKNVGTISGTGFGLAIVKNFIDRLNGEIIISSKINCGTSVQLIFKK